MSVQTSSKYLYTNRKNTVYKESDVIEIDIPAGNMFINTKDTYIVANVRMSSNQYKLCPSQRAGLSGLIRNLQVSAGSGQVMESIANYGFLYANKDYYESSPALENRKYLHEGKPNKVTIDDQSGNQYLDVTASVNSNEQKSALGENVYKQVEACIPLYLSGCLSPHRKDVFPCVATRGLNLRIELVNAITALMYLKAPLYMTVDSENYKTGEFGGYQADEGYAILADVAKDEKTIKLKHDGDVLLSATQESATPNRVLSANVKNAGHIFMNGQYVSVNGTVYQIDTVSLDENNNITLLLKDGLKEAVSQDQVVFVSTDNAYNDANFELSNVRMNLGLVQTSPEYVQSALRKIKAGKFQFDIFSFTDYGMNIANQSNNNSLKINCRNTRALSLMSIPQRAKLNSLNEDSYQSDKEEPRDYNLKLYNNIVVPDKLVPLDKFNNDNEALYNAVALREMHKSLSACPGWVVNNLKNPSQQFFIGRKLANKGYSYNCNNELTLNINYTQVNALLMHNFLCHLRRIDCRDDGVYVTY